MSRLLPLLMLASLAACPSPAAEPEPAPAAAEPSPEGVIPPASRTTYPPGTLVADTGNGEHPQLLGSVALLSLHRQVGAVGYERLADEPICGPMECWVSLAREANLHRVVLLTEEAGELHVRSIEDGTVAREARAALPAEGEERWEVVRHTLGDVLGADAVLPAGRLEVEAATQTLSSVKGRVRGCFKGLLRGQPGGLGVTLRVDADGGVGRIVINRVTHADEDARACVLAVLAHAGFAAPSGGSEIIHLDLDFPR